MDDLIQQLVDFLAELALLAFVIFVGYLLVRFVLVKLFGRLLHRYGVDEVFVRFASI